MVNTQKTLYKKIKINYIIKIKSRKNTVNEG